jgi:hypothetical protein
MRASFRPQSALAPTSARKRKRTHEHTRARKHARTHARKNARTQARTRKGGATQARTHTHAQTDRQTDGQTDRHSHRQTHSHSLSPQPASAAEQSAASMQRATRLVPCSVRHLADTSRAVDGSTNLDAYIERIGKFADVRVGFVLIVARDSARPDPRGPCRLRNAALIERLGLVTRPRRKPVCAHHLAATADACTLLEYTHRQAAVVQLLRASEAG